LTKNNNKDIVSRYSRELKAVNFDRPTLTVKVNADTLSLRNLISDD